MHSFEEPLKPLIPPVQLHPLCDTQAQNGICLFKPRAGVDKVCVQEAGVLQRFRVPAQLRPHFRLHFPASTGAKYHLQPFSEFVLFSQESLDACMCWTQPTAATLTDDQGHACNG